MDIVKAIIEGTIQKGDSPTRINHRTKEVTLRCGGVFQSHHSIDDFALWKVTEDKWCLSLNLEPYAFIKEE